MDLYDMHCHLDFLSDVSGDALPASGRTDPTGEADAPHPVHPARMGAAALASEGEARGIGAFSTAVTPSGSIRAARLLGACGNVRVGVGLHPWWVADGSIGEEEMRLFEKLAAESAFIGEIGLDFASRWVEARDAQAAAFARALDACSDGGRVVSIHAVRSASTVLDMLDERGSCGRNACILHWFSGTSDELARAVRLGCYFSFNPRMMATKRGRAYARSIPVDRLLLETDMPAGEGALYSVGEWERDLRGVLADVAAARRADADALAETISLTSSGLLGAG